MRKSVRLLPIMSISVRVPRIPLQWGAGLLSTQKMLEHEVTRLCGQRYGRQADRKLTRYGRQPGVITLTGEGLHLQRSGRRRTDGPGDAELETYGAPHRENAVPRPWSRAWSAASRVSTTTSMHFVSQISPTNSAEQAVNLFLNLVAYQLNSI
jgi:hypothetical protein